MLCVFVIVLFLGINWILRFFILLGILNKCKVGLFLIVFLVIVLLVLVFLIIIFVVFWLFLVGIVLNLKINLEFGFIVKDFLILLKFLWLLVFVLFICFNVSILFCVW